MKGILRIGLVILLGSVVAFAADKDAANQDQPALTIYNQNFAVVRQTIPLDLKSGVNHLDYTDIKRQLEPDSVVLRSLDGRSLQILEQNYRNDPVSQNLLLSLFEGQTIDFQLLDKDNNVKIVKGKIVRSPKEGEPLIEVDGKLQFSLPGTPQFPALADDTVLKPTLAWEIQSDRSGTGRAEFSYVTGGLSWHADYNLVAPPKGNTLQMVGWVTLQNDSGKNFREARVKLMAGDVNKVQQNTRYEYGALKAMAQAAPAPPAVTEKAFDEYHLYTLQHPSTLHDHETKQVEFVHAEGVQSQTIYVYDGAQLDYAYAGNSASIRNNPNYGTQSNKKIWVMQEFKNSDANHLGIPLPAGRVRFYRRDDDGQLEFTGENTIDHTPKDETLRLYTGNAFDVVGERVRTNYKSDVTKSQWVDESFTITLRNHKKETVNVRVAEHLYRWTNWDITQKSDDFTKKDSQTIEFNVPVDPDAERKVTYTVHYTW